MRPDLAPPRPSSAASVTGTLLVVAVYVHFLAFTQFGLLEGLRASELGGEAVHRILGAMALAGIAAGFLGAALTPRVGSPRIAAAGFALAACAGFTAAVILRYPENEFSIFLLVSSGSGAGLGLATVGCAATLRPLVRARAVGLHVGLGTGFAYALASAPPVFQASPATKAWLAALAAVAGGIAALAAGRILTHRDRPWLEAAPPHPVRVFAIVAATVSFLALVSFDSAAFAAIQGDAMRKARFWSEPATLWGVSAAHLVAAPLAGHLLDRHRLATVLVAAGLLIVSGHLCFHLLDTTAAWPAATYAAGVALYSTALAAFAALAPALPGSVPAVWRAAWVYAIAGWIGSGAGIAVAEQYGGVPQWAAPIAAALLAAGLVAARRQR